MECGGFLSGENKDKMVSGTSVKITNISQVRHESLDCLATAAKKNSACVVTVKLILLPPGGGLLLHAVNEPARRLIKRLDSPKHACAMSRPNHLS